ncbi:hypothetical protein EDB84DRAFT_759130 [Lactarius hengduanensis]|nr:hypothetical protein EDB84DRAFT_759130 [Lactarius hengduanensis]
MTDIWAMVYKSPPTNLVDSLFYGVPGVMGYPPYGIREVQLQVADHHTRKSTVAFRILFGAFSRYTAHLCTSYVPQAATQDSQPHSRHSRLACPAPHSSPTASESILVRGLIYSRVMSVQRSSFQASSFLRRSVKG